MVGKKITFKSAHVLKNLLGMSSKNFSLDVRPMTAVNENKNNVFIDEITAKEPFAIFKTWYDEACSTPSILEPRAMCLATCTRSGIPSARFVILRGYGQDGFTFFTNYCSRKGKELIENPNAAVVFYWEPLKKSVQIEGTVIKTSEEESVEFFHSRPKAYQVEAAFSNQSQPVSSRNALIQKQKKFEQQYLNCSSIPKPKDWGGFLLKPNTIEFWQDQSKKNSVTHRIRFKIKKINEVADNILLYQGENNWVYERL